MKEWKGQQLEGRVKTATKSSEEEETKPVFQLPNSDQLGHNEGTAMEQQQCKWR
jgi:hypothetical protein